MCWFDLSGNEACAKENAADGVSPMRDKLIELLKEKYDHYCDQCGVNKQSHYIENLADYLIANGVTFAEDNNVGCKYCKEDKDGYRVMFGAFSIHNPFHGNIWEIDAGRCKPRRIYFCPMCGRKLTEPPKEGE